MSILSVDNISPIGSGTSVTINNAATLVLNNLNVSGVSTFSNSVIVNGNTGIGTDNPTDILDINSDSASAVSNVYIRNHANLGGAALNLFTQGTYASPTYKAIIGCSDAGGNIRMGSASNHDLLLLTNNTARVTVKTNGDVEIADGNLVMANGHGIDFSAQTAASSGSVVSEVMNHFSTGTIGITLKAGSNTVPLYDNTARYTRIGNICFISIWIRVNGSTVGSSYSSSDTLKLTGLPFAGSGNNDGRTRMRFNGYAFTGVSNKTWGWMVVSDGATTTEHELHWGEPSFNTIIAPNGTNIHNSSSEIYINGHDFV